MSAIGNYFKEILEVVQSTRKGMALTWKHAWNARKQRTVHQIQDAGYFQQSEGIVTLEYPSLQIPTPVNGRYQLHNEMDDCIVCDKCVKVCPVDCIDIEPIKATGLVGHASDGSPIRLYAAKFDIDMSKCCFCGLCTTVCPTECLTMTSEYDFSVFDVKDHNFSFANLTPEQADEKRKLYEQFVAEKAAMKAGASHESSGPKSEGQTSNDQGLTSQPKPAFKPSFKKVTSPESPVASQESGSPKSEGPTSNDQSPTSQPKPAFKPSFKKVTSPESPVASQESGSPKSEGPTSNDQSPTSQPKPAFKPSFKKVTSPESPVASQESGSPKSEGQTFKDQSLPSNSPTNNPDLP
jgi:formate hydrogenlyase subunit 6/NADH:ubiquinone oxidoreductase subunit I